MKKAYFVAVEIGDRTFYRGIWATIDEAIAWSKEYWNENKTAKFTIELMGVMSSMVTI